MARATSSTSIAIRIGSFGVLVAGVEVLVEYIGVIWNRIFDS